MCCDVLCLRFGFAGMNLICVLCCACACALKLTSLSERSDQSILKERVCSVRKTHLGSGRIYNSIVAAAQDELAVRVIFRFFLLHGSGKQSTNTQPPKMLNGRLACEEGKREKGREGKGRKPALRVHGHTILHTNHCQLVSKRRSTAASFRRLGTRVFGPLPQSKAKQSKINTRIDTRV